MLKHNPKEVVTFHFIVKTYYRDVAAGYDKQHEVSERMTLKLFKSWFKLMKSKNRLLYGTLRFAGGETWIWQPTFLDRSGKKCGGWQIARKSNFEKKQEERRQWENFIFSTVGLTSF